MKYVLLILCALSCACVHRQELRPLRVDIPNPSYYKLGVMIDRSALLANPNKISQAMTKDARALLKSGAKVAIVPPDQCQTTSATAQGSKDSQTFAVMECGVLISDLELTLATFGYEVVSWQQLRLSNGQGVDRGAQIERAKALGIDLLFEINEFGKARIDLDQIYKVHIDFTSQTNASDMSPLAVPRTTVLSTCKSQIDDAIRSIKANELIVTLALKAVEVESGRSLWLYQNNVYDNENKKEVVDASLYYKQRVSVPSDVEERNKAAKREVSWSYEREDSVRFVVGCTSILAGISWAFLVAAKNPEEMDVFGADVQEFAGEEVVLRGAVAGTAFFTLLHAFALSTFRSSYGDGDAFVRRWNAQRLIADVGDPEEVICLTNAVIPPWIQVISAPQADQGRTSSFSYEQQIQGSGDAERARTERVMRLAVQDFKSALIQFTR